MTTDFRASRRERTRCVWFDPMKISCQQKEAIAALLAHPSVTVAASVVGIPLQTLLRWINIDKGFAAAYKAARRAENRQSMGRLRQGATGAATSIRREMADRNAKPATRLKAAMIVIGEALDAMAMEDFAAVLTEVEEAQTAPAGSHGKSRIAGHGAKFPRKKERAITALLTQRSVAEAAAVAGIGTQTLYRWMEDGEFDAALETREPDSERRDRAGRNGRGTSAGAGR